jgi:uncharacterized protein with HEPN domain
MSIQPATAKRLHDARAAGEELLGYCEGRTRDDLFSDRTLQLVSQRLIEIIGEALRQAEQSEPTIGDRIERIRDIVGTRNLLVHGYGDVNYSLIWDMIEIYVPRLIETVDSILEDAGGKEDR